MSWEDFLNSDYNIDDWNESAYKYTRRTNKPGGGYDYINYDIGENTIGISTGLNGVTCGRDNYGNWFYFDNYMLIINTEGNYATLDMKIINGYNYGIDGGMGC